MKRVGLIAGIGPVSTVDYYERIISIFRARLGGFATPEIIIYSINMGEQLTLMESGDLKRLTDLLVEKVNRLVAAGADFGAIASNTPHVVFDEVRARSPIPLISIVEETLHKVQGLGLHKPGLIGTLFTMRHGFFEKVFGTAGITLYLPDIGDQELIHRRLFTEIELGVVKDSTRTELLNIVGKLVDNHSIDSLILGCTELPSILDKDEFGIKFLDTTGIHVESIVNYCIGE